MLQRLAMLLAVLGLALPASAQIGSGAHPFPDTSNGIYIFTDQLPDASQLSSGQWQFIASHYVGTQKELLSWTQYVRTLNPSFIVLHYQLSLGAGTAQFIDGNSWTNDFSYVTTQESWFLHDGSGNRLAQNAYGWNIMNIVFSNGAPVSGWPNYWVTTAEQRLRDNQNDGVFADSYTQDILFDQESPAYIWFTDVTSCQNNWIPNLNQYGPYCYNALHSQPEVFYYLPNLGQLITSWDTTHYGIGDGGMNEGFCLSGSNSYYALSDWQLQMNRLLALITSGKIVLCQSYISSNASNDLWFVVGSYLLVKGHKTLLNMFQNNSLEWYPQYTVNLGAYSAEPATNISAYWNASWGVYQRNYASGFVLVNPGTTQVRIKNLGGTYKLVSASGGGAVPSSGAQPGSLSTTKVTSVTIPAHSARVLLY